MSNDVCNSPWLSIRAAPSFVQRELGDDEACLFLVKAANEPATAANKIERRCEHRDGRRARPRAGQFAKTSRLKGGARLRLVAGNVEVSKADLILEALKENT